MAASSATDPLIGHWLNDRYEIVRRIARGGMAMVYEGIDTRLSRVVAVKVMHDGLGDDPDFVGRFDTEARAAAQLTHPNAVSVFDQGIEGNRPYIVMEYVDGMTLRSVITREAPLSPRRALELLEPVCAALAAAHQAELIHRDVKPENVLISQRGLVKVADFGLASTIQAAAQRRNDGSVIGTASYIAPELVTGGHADPRSDVYSLGIVLYELLTGTKPHKGATPTEVAQSHVYNHTPAPSEAQPVDRQGRRVHIPDYVDALVLSATARQRIDRPHDAAVLLAHVRQVRAALDDGISHDPALAQTVHATDMPDTPVPPPHHHDEPASSSPSSASGRIPPPSQWQYTPVHRRRRRLVGIGVLLVVLSLVGGGWWMFIGRLTPIPRLDGMTGHQASAAITQRGLKAHTAHEYSDTVEPGLVTRADPEMGTRTEPGSTVTIYLSRGAELFTVPTLVGLSQDAALAALTQASLAPGSIAEEYHDTVPSGRIISQSVAANTKVPRSRKIDLVVSKGGEPVTLPDVTGTSQAEAKKTLKDVGLRARVLYDWSSTVAKDAVISQRPGSGTVHRGDTIVIVVSRGPRS